MAKLRQIRSNWIHIQKIFYLCWTIVDHCSRLRLILMSIYGRSVIHFDRGGGGGLVVKALAFYSDKPSLNPAKVNSFCAVNWQRMKINKIEAAWVWPLCIEVVNLFQPTSVPVTTNSWWKWTRNRRSSWRWAKSSRSRTSATRPMCSR